MGTAPRENMVDAMKFCFMAFDIPENAMKTSYRSTINAVKVFIWHKTIYQ